MGAKATKTAKAANKKTKAKKPKKAAPKLKVVESDDDDFIRAEDFNSIEIKIHLINNTTHTEVKDGKKIYGSKKAPQKKGASEEEGDFKVQFIEFLDKGMIIEVPARSCAMGHTLTLDINTVGARENIHFATSVKVSDSEALKDGRDRITVTLVQYEEYEWNGFKNLFANRQQEILDFFEAAKGM